MADVKLLLGKLVKKNVTKDQITPDFPNYELQLKENENCFIFGPVGTGKTVLLKDMVEEAIIAKHPCLVIDPKGDLAQLAWLCDDASTQALVAASFVPQDVFQDYRKQYERFGILDRPQLYGDSVHVQLLDHNFKPDSNAIKRLFEIRTDGRTPLTICYLHLTNSDRAKQAVLNLLRSIEAAKDELSKTEGMKFLFIDEAHRFNNDKAPDVYNALRLILREECRPVKLTVVMSTQKLNDFELQELKASSFKHFFEFENMNYNCKVLGPNEVGKPNQKPPSQYLHPRWTLTVHRQEPMKLPEIERTMSLRNIQTHRINPDLLKPDLTGYPKNNALEEMDWKILSCLNDIPFSVEWNPKPLENVMGSDFRSQIAEALEFLKNSKELMATGHYHAWLDYSKAGFPITAFFVAQGRGSWEEQLDKIKIQREVIELFEINSPKYIDVNILAKLRFKSMDHYYTFVTNNLLSMSVRGMSLEERFKKYAQEWTRMKEDGRRSHPIIPPEQIVSGCISARMFSEHPSCYIQERTCDFLKGDDDKEDENRRNILRHLVELEGEKLYLEDADNHHINLDKPAEEIIHRLGDTSLRADGVIERIRKMAQIGIIRGAYLEMPWEFLGYNTVFVLGQLNFLETLDGQVGVIADQHEVQESHVIVGPYDLLVKIRCPEKEGQAQIAAIVQGLNLKDYVLLEVKRWYKTGFRMTGMFS